jgi:hypothetical protein
LSKLLLDIYNKQVEFLNSKYNLVVSSLSEGESARWTQHYKIQAATLKYAVDVAKGLLDLANLSIDKYNAQAKLYIDQCRLHKESLKASLVDLESVELEISQQAIPIALKTALLNTAQIRINKTIAEAKAHAAMIKATVSLSAEGKANAELLRSRVIAYMAKLGTITENFKVFFVKSEAYDENINLYHEKINVLKERIRIAESVAESTGMANRAQCDAAEAEIAAEKVHIEIADREFQAMKVVAEAELAKYASTLSAEEVALVDWIKSTRQTLLEQEYAMRASAEDYKANAAYTGRVGSSEIQSQVEASAIQLIAKIHADARESVADISSCANVEAAMVHSLS